MIHRLVCAFPVLLTALLVLPACSGRRYAPELASRAYPTDLHSTQTARMQVFRSGPKLEVVNATAVSYTDVDIWLNQRYAARVASLPAGETTTLDLRDFYDVRGETLNAGGLFREFEATPVRLVELQPTPDSPTIGLITVRAERAE